MTVLDVWKRKRMKREMLAKCSKGKTIPKKGLKELLNLRVHA